MKQLWSRIRKRYIGDRSFYRRVLMVALPIFVQTGITNCVQLVDNVMVGMTGTDQMSGVAVVNTLIFVFDVCIFGVVSGASIFGAQYYGSGDEDGFRKSFCFKLIYGAAALAIGLIVFAGWGGSLISSYLHEGGTSGNLEATLGYGMSYLHIMMIGLPMFVIVQAYASSLREMGKTVLPMCAGIAAILVNMGLNYVLIFGKLGAPRLGVAGAAIATVISRYVEAGIVIVYVHRRVKEYPFAQNILGNILVPWRLQRRILKKGAPLMLNEALWSGSVALQSQLFSIRGLAVVASLNICSTLSNVFNIFFIAMGSAVATLVGQLLGADRMEEAKETDRKLIAACVAGCVVMAVIMFFASPAFPGIYNTTDEIKALATTLLRIQAVFIPMSGFLHTCYFTLRSGGKTMITFAFDSLFMWVVNIPLAFILTRATDLPITWIFFWSLACELIKCLVGYIMLKKGVWINNIVGKDEF